MKEKDVNLAGMLIAASFALMGTVGYFLTHDRLPANVNYVWLATYVVALFTLSAAVVNFDMKRLIK